MHPTLASPPAAIARGALFAVLLCCHAVRADAAVGAGLDGLDFGNPLVPSTIDAICRAWPAYPAIFFRGWKLTPQAHARFAARGGGIDHPRLS